MHVTLYIGSLVVSCHAIGRPLSACQGRDRYDHGNCFFNRRCFGRVNVATAVDSGGNRDIARLFGSFPSSRRHSRRVVSRRLSALKRLPMLSLVFGSSIKTFSLFTEGNKSLHDFYFMFSLFLLLLCSLCSLVLCSLVLCLPCTLLPLIFYLFPRSTKHSILCRFLLSSLLSSTVFFLFLSLHISRHHLASRTLIILPS